MPIQVVCPSCHARFSVSEKFAGKKGPCPKCKTVIQVPEATEEIKIHAPEQSEAGAKGTGGRHVLKPIERKETKVQPRISGATTLANRPPVAYMGLEASDRLGADD
jgi:predicted Zn finger-like uncharacterized protein